ncbi:MAG: ISL3 family transposase [Acutalibacteraceae bacterium]|nr:ISL3 family transposase [Acutalibacteraceae bacterium]
MLYTYSTEELIGLQDLIIERIKSNEKEIHIYGKLTRKAHCCPNCLAKTDKIHDYREQIIKDIPVYGKAAYIHLQKRRYRCQCGKRFYEKNIFLPRYHRRTNRLSAYIIDRLRKMVTFTDVGKEVNLSTTTIMRTFDLVSYSPRDLPTTLSIDEFKGNTNKEKYQCIITDPVNKTVLDILPKRYESYLTTYFLGFEKSKRDKVTAFVSDMWKPYSSLATKLFKNAKQIVDKYHWIRQVFWAFDGVRKDIQKELGKDYRIYFKHSRKLLFKRFNELDDEQKQQVNVMLALSPTLYTAHFYKEDFLKILDCNDRDSAKSALSEWINCAFDCGIERFKKCAQTMINWMTGILNSFSTPVTNGFTEGCNNKIKVLKRIAFGYQNFHRFRNRILHIFANQFS